MEVCGVDSNTNPNPSTSSVVDTPDREVPSGTAPPARLAESAAKTTPTPTVAKGIARPVAAKATAATLESAPDSAVNKQRRRIVWAGIAGLRTICFPALND